MFIHVYTCTYETSYHYKNDSKLMFRCNIMTKTPDEFLGASYTDFKLIQKNRRPRIAKKILKTGQG